MLTKTVYTIILCVSFHFANAQSSITKPAWLNYEMDSAVRKKILVSLDTLFAQIKRGGLQKSIIDTANQELSVSILSSLAGVEDDQKDSVSNFFKKQLINLYPISANEYFAAIAFIGNKKNAEPVLKNIINLIVKKIDNVIVFSIPLKYFTSTWKTYVAGNITYHFKDEINTGRAAKFNAKNTSIARRLGLQPEKMNFYLCNNYQEILQLLGYGYDMESNGKTRDGYGVDANTIFSIMHNEDFSHDVFHHYSEKIRGEIRNRSAEEGIAYSWGNAYYTKPNGEMAEQKELVQNLKAYLKQKPLTDLLELFNKNPKVLVDLPAEISVKSVIASLLCNEVERKKGIDGIKTLLKCGRGDENFFKALEKLVGIDQNNFNKEMLRLIEEYK